MMSNFYRQTLIPFLGLFTSVGTLVCCALPALLVTLGMGAALAGIVSNIPWLVALSAHKGIVFTIAGIMLGLSAFIQWRGRHAPCPADPVQARVCARLRRLGYWALMISVAVYGVGFFFAFLAAEIFYG